MSFNNTATRLSRIALTHCRSSGILRFAGRGCSSFHTSSSRLVPPFRSVDEVFCSQISVRPHSAINSSTFQWFRFFSSATPQSNEESAESKNPQEHKRNSETGAASSQSNEKETGRSRNEQEGKGNNEATADTSHQTEASVSDSSSESDSESGLSRDELVKLVVEKEQLLETKTEELQQMKDKVLRAYADMENVKDRTRRESENAKKFAIQNFAKSLLDVADNLNRASSAAKESFSKMETSSDTAEAVKQLKTLLEGVEMTEKQLIGVFKKFGMEKYNPVDEEFDPNKHNAVFQVPDASKPAGHVAVVLKAGYVLHDRVIRPAEVGVTVAVDNDEAKQESDA